MGAVRTMVAVIMVVAGASCAPMQRVIAPPYPTPTARPLDVTVHVTNDHWLRVRVWADFDGIHHFLGEVDPGTAAAFVLPSDLCTGHGPLRLVADPTGSADQAASGALDLIGVRRIDWRLHRVLGSSRVRILES